MDKTDKVFFAALIVITIGLLMFAVFSTANYGQLKKQADEGNGYWCPKHGEYNTYHYSKSDCIHENKGESK